MIGAAEARAAAPMRSFCDRRAEQREDCISRGLYDVAIVAMDRVDHQLEAGSMIARASSGSSSSINSVEPDGPTKYWPSRASRLAPLCSVLAADGRAVELLLRRSET